MTSFPLFKLAKKQDIHNPTCKECGCDIKLTPAQKWKLINGYSKNVFCSRRCRAMSSRNQLISRCKICGTPVSRTPSEAKKSKSGHAFCSLGCSAIWSNYKSKKFKNTSKLEVQILTALSQDFPELEIHTNSNAAIGAELDLFFPTIELGIEINGPYHYAALRGDEKKLLSTIANDKRKQKMAAEAGIKLYVLNSSQARGKAAFARYYPQIKALITKFLANLSTEDEAQLELPEQEDQKDMPHPKRDRRAPQL